MTMLLAILIVLGDKPKTPPFPPQGWR